MPVTGRTLRLERELRKELAKITDQHTRDMVRAWAVAWDEIAPDLTDTLAKLLADGDLTRADLLKSIRLRKSLNTIAIQLNALIADTNLTVTGKLRDVVDAAGQAQAALIDSQLPADTIDLDSWSRVDERQIKAIVQRSTEQITSRTKPIGPKAYAAVQRELVRGVAAGSNPRETAVRIVKRAEGEFNGREGLARALTIARTETLDAHRAGAAAGQAQHTDVLTGWTWLAALGPRTCSACWGMNGTFHELDEPGPDGHQNCRCARVPATKPWSELGIKVKEPPSAMPDADAQFARLTPAEQQKVLGRRGFEAWEQGKFPREKWATRQRNPGWRDSFVPAAPPKVKMPKRATIDSSKKKRGKKNATKKPPLSPTSKLLDLKKVPKIDPVLIQNMEKRGVDVVEWNRKATNPKYGTDPSYGINCQRVVQANELRSRGYNVTAKPYPGDGSAQAQVFLKWINSGQQRAVDNGRYLVSKQTKSLIDQQDPVLGAKMITDAEQYVTDVVESWPEGARGWVAFYRSGRRGGHIFNVERTATGVRVVEAQLPNGGQLNTLSHYMNQVRLTRPSGGTLTLGGHDVFLLRVDDLEFNSGVMEAITWT